MSETELSWFIDNTISRRLQASPGVARDRPARRRRPRDQCAHRSRPSRRPRPDRRGGQRRPEPRQCRRTRRPHRYRWPRTDAAGAGRGGQRRSDSQPVDPDRRGRLRPPRRRRRRRRRLGRGAHLRPAQRPSGRRLRGQQDQGRQRGLHRGRRRPCHRPARSASIRA